MTAPNIHQVLEDNPSHAQLCRVWGDAYSTEARPFLSVSKEEVLMFEQGVEILLVEHNADCEMLTLLAFKRQKIAGDIHVVRDGAEALEYLFCTGAYAARRFENPKLILLDLNLPRINGIEVLRQIRSDPRTRLVPVVMLTSSNEECDINDAYRMGINSYIVKPLDFEKFNEVVKYLGFYWLTLNRLPTTVIGSRSETNSKLASV